MKRYTPPTTAEEARQRRLMKLQSKPVELIMLDAGSFGAPESYFTGVAIVYPGCPESDDLDEQDDVESFIPFAAETICAIGRAGLLHRQIRLTVEAADAPPTDLVPVDVLRDIAQALRGGWRAGEYERLIPMLEELIPGDI